MDQLNTAKLGGTYARTIRQAVTSVPNVLRLI